MNKYSHMDEYWMELVKYLPNTNNYDMIQEYMNERIAETIPLPTSWCNSTSTTIQQPFSQTDNHRHHVENDMIQNVNQIEEYWNELLNE
jgi:hypothetical protein